MPGRIEWDKTAERIYSTGVSKVVLFPPKGEKAIENSKYGNAVAWNGVTGITKNVSGGEAQTTYADNIEYLNLMSAEKVGLTIETVTVPDEFLPCDGIKTIPVNPEKPEEGYVIVGAQKRAEFGLAWRTEIGNGEDENFGYEIHIAYGIKASPSEQSYKTIGESPEAATFSYTCNTTPPAIPAGAEWANMKPTSYFKFSSLKFKHEVMKELEDVLYGSEKADGCLPTIDILLGKLKAVQVVPAG